MKGRELMSNYKETDLSFIFPCLNEKETIEGCIQELKQVLSSMNVSYEIIISDNGSTDGSLEIAQKYSDVRIVNTVKKGYGEALKNGFAHANGKYIAFADIDGSYPLYFLPQMYEKIRTENADMVVASRMTGKIEDKAMPFMHRYLGTPVLTWIINFLFKGELTDCNSGFRIMKNSAYQSWNVTSSGMEFASELLIKALKNKAKIVEIPAALNRDKRSKIPHLNTWRDGMRHLLFILSESPKFFEFIGLIFFIIFSIFEIMSIFLAPLNIGSIAILNYHSQLIFIILSALGLQIWGFSMVLYIFSPKEKPYKISQLALNMPENKLFSILMCLLALIFYCILSVFIKWSKANFQEINLIYYILPYLYVITTISSGIFSLLSVHVIKRKSSN